MTSPVAQVVSVVLSEDPIATFELLLTSLKDKIHQSGRICF